MRNCSTKRPSGLNKYDPGDAWHEAILILEAIEVTQELLANDDSARALTILDLIRPRLMMLSEVLEGPALAEARAQRS